MAETVKILGIAGSLRKDSYNRLLLGLAGQLVPPGAVLETFDLEGIPVYNQDNELSPPQKILELKRLVRAADALLFVTPEHNFSIPAALKNVIDWVSRPPRTTPGRASRPQSWAPRLDEPQPPGPRPICGRYSHTWTCIPSTSPW